MLIGLTVLGTDSVFAKGCNRTAIAFAFWCSKNGHSVTIISPNSIKNPFNELEATFKEKNIKCNSLEEVISSKQVYDYMFEIAWYIPEGVRLKISNKHIIWFHQPPLFNDMESSVFFFNNFIRSMKNVSEVWIPDCYSIEDKMYIERIYSIPARFVPWIWEHVSLDTYCANNRLSKWNQFENPESQLIVLESNNTNTSNCTLPLCIIAEITEKTPMPWIVGNGEILKKNKYFNGNVVNNLFSGKDVSGNFIGRIPVPELRKFRSVLIAHQRWRSMKHLLLDALWLDIPTIHNCAIIQERLKAAGGYYYPANEISTAVNQFRELTRDMQTSNGYFSKEALFQRKVYCVTQYDWESDKSQKFFTEALLTPLQQITNLVKQPEIKNVLSIAFTDMWFEFNPKYNFFTCLLEDEIKKQGLALELRVVEEKPNLVIFGPFGDGHRKYDGIPKIFFSGENNLHIEGPEIILSIGHSPEVNAKTLRIPLWILEVNWFNADPAQIKNPKPIPYEVCTKPQVNLLAKKSEFASYIVSNPKNEHRNAALGEISKYKRVDSAGAHMNNMGMKLEGGLGGGGGEMVKHEFLQKYKFNVCFENASEPGYITEKYFHAKAAGCIPIYWGDSNLGRDFNSAGGINTHGMSWDQVRTEIQAIDTDPIKYLQMFSIPAITPEAEVFARKQMKRLVDIMLPFANTTNAKVPAAVTATTTPPVLIPIQVPVLGTDPHFYTATNSKYLPNLLPWFEGLIKQKIPLNKATVYYWPDASNEIEIIKQKYSAVTFTPFPVSDPSQIPWKDFWEPQHYGWKLWLIHQNLGTPGIYMDVGVLLVRPIADIYEIIQKEGVFMLEDENNNKNWCHEKFVKMMNCSEDELNSKQLQAAVLGWNTAFPAAKKLFTHAFYYTKARDILVGEKWIQNPTTHVYGHRHDQSILSILSYREKTNRRPLAKFTTGESFTAAVNGGYAFFHHRGNIVSDGGISNRGKVLSDGGISNRGKAESGTAQKEEFAARITEATVINLDKRTDRYQSFKDFHSYMSDKIKRHSACYGLELKLTPEIKHLFRNNDFKWKKAVMGCAISHNQIWQRLAKESSDDYSCLILEDDVRFYPQWLDVWKEASKMIPADADIIYLGGILPPNKNAFASAITLVNMHFSKVIPNEIFSPGNPKRYFHSCNYAYIMFSRGARKIAKIIEDRGIFTSGDHMIVNHMENLNVYFMHPIVAGCFQDTDPIYQKSQFNNFERVDNFDSDLWNNTECFTPVELQEDSIKPAENNDTMANGLNIECNAILLKLSQGKIPEMTEMCLAFFEKELSVTVLSERNFNWIRVIQQVLLSQKSKMTNEQIINVITKLAIYCKITPNMVLRKITEEIIEKYNEDITARPPGVPYYPSPNFATNSYSVWYFVPNQQNVFLEREWLEEIIGKPLEFRAYGSSDTYSSQSIHFILLQKWQGVESMVLEKLNTLATANHSAVLLHLSDENLNDPLEIYNHPAVKLVIRNYVRADIPPSDKIITIPLGYVKNRSLKGKFKKLADRTLSWSFAGSVDKPTRIEMLQTLSKIEPNSMKLLPTWKQPQPEEADEYMTILGDSKFIPCPMGQNYETYRLYEALEAGCIPICIGDTNNQHECYNKLIGDNAILISQDWTSVKSMIQQICNNPDALNQIQDNLTKYWTTHKINITSHIFAALEKISKNYL
jgi:GR25 family glycosyltransferase involved in LPS biosynthesis